MAEKGELNDKIHIIARYRDRAVDQKLIQFVMMEKIKGMEPEQKNKAVSQQLLMDVRDDIVKIDGRMSAENFYGVLGVETIGEARARYAASMLFMDVLMEQTEVLLAKAGSKEGITREDYKNALAELRAVTERKALDYQQIYEKKYYDGRKVIDIKSAMTMLSLQYLLERTQSMFGKGKRKAA